MGNLDALGGALPARELVVRCRARSVSEDEALASPRDGGAEEITEDEWDAAKPVEQLLEERGVVALQSLEQAPAVQEAALSPRRGRTDA